jgi:hypothetical protein
MDMIEREVLSPERHHGIMPASSGKRMVSRIVRKARGAKTVSAAGVGYIIQGIIAESNGRKTQLLR